MTYKRKRLDLNDLDLIVRKRKKKIINVKNPIMRVTMVRMVMIVAVMVLVVVALVIILQLQIE